MLIPASHRFANQHALEAFLDALVTKHRGHAQITPDRLYEFGADVLMASFNDVKALQRGFIRRLIRFSAPVDRNSALVEISMAGVFAEQKDGDTADPVVARLEEVMNMLRGASGNRFFVSKLTDNKGRVFARAAPSLKGKPPARPTRPDGTSNVRRGENVGDISIRTETTPLSDLPPEELEEFLNTLTVQGMQAYEKPKGQGKRWTGLVVGTWPSLEEAAMILPTLDGSFFSRGENQEPLLVQASSKHLHANMTKIKDLAALLDVLMPAHSDFSAIDARATGRDAAAGNSSQ